MSPLSVPQKPAPTPAALAARAVEELAAGGLREASVYALVSIAGTLAAGNVGGCGFVIPEPDGNPIPDTEARELLVAVLAGRIRDAIETWPHRQQRPMTDPVPRAQGGAWAEHVERQRAMKRERDGDCICNTGPDTDGPDEFCPWHGRPYPELVEQLTAARNALEQCQCWVGHGDCGGCSGVTGIAHESACGWDWNPSCPVHGLLAAEVAQLRRGGTELGKIIRRDCQAILDMTGLHDLIGEDGDGDWAAVWENLAEMVAAGRAVREGAGDSTAARIHSQWTQTRRRIKYVRALCAAPFDTLEVESDDGGVQSTEVVRVADVLAILNGDSEAK